MPQSAKGSRVRYLAVAVAAVGVAFLLGKSVLGPAPADATKNAVQNAGASVPLSTQWPRPESASRPTGLTPQPPGPVPAGKVWSPEHGHWHDATPATSQVGGGSGNVTLPGPASVGLTPQPPGPVPEGKVWSPEHGHWHDIAAPPAAPAAP